MILLRFFVSGTFVFGYVSCNPVFAAQTEPAARSSLQSDAPVMPKPNRWQASTDRFHYDFKGTRPGRGNLYSFDQVTFDTQVFSLAYLQSPTLKFSLVSSYNQLYAETYFSGVLYKDKTYGFGDTSLKTAKTWLTDSGVWVLDVSTSFPTGSVSRKNANNTQYNYPYNMQLGSGTQDFTATGLYIKPINKNSIGAMASGTLRTGQNSEGYRKGNELILRTWYNYSIAPYFSPGVWLNYHHINRIEGQDRTFGRSDYVEFYHAPRSFWDITPNVNSEYGFTSHFKMRGSAGIPVLQHSRNVDDIQLDLKWFAQLGIEGTF